MRQVTRLSVIAAVLVSLGSAACTPEDAAAPAELPVTESNGPAGDVPESLGTFYEQSLTWDECAPFATTRLAEQLFAQPGMQCARLKVPLDYADPDGEVITLGVLRKPAQGDGERIGSLVINPGGPGVSGMEAAAGLSGTPAMQALGSRFAVVGFDPRGLGASEPALKCLTGQERDADRADDVEADGSAEGVAKQEAEERAFARKCAQRTEHGEEMLANLGTRDVAKDMDVLRSALGDEKLTYLGYSYGTRIGTAYAEAFPRNVRAMILDGALDPEKDAVESLVDQGEGFGKAFDEFAKWCAKRSDCALGNDPKQASENYQQLAQPLVDRNVSLSDGRQLSFDDITTAAVHTLYSQSSWERLNSGLNDLKRNRGETLMALADEYNERDADGSYAGVLDALVAVRCADDPPVTDKQKIRDAQRRYARVAPFLDSGKPAGDALDACAFWPVEHTSEPHLPEIEGLPPTLVISTTKDPATPYQAGVQLAKALDGRLLTFEGTQHTVFGHGEECVDKAGVAYLVDRTLPEDGTRCSG